MKIRLSQWPEILIVDLRQKNIVEYPFIEIRDNYGDIEVQINLYWAVARYEYIDGFIYLSVQIVLIF